MTFTHRDPKGVARKMFGRERRACERRDPEQRVGERLGCGRRACWESSAPGGACSGAQGRSARLAQAGLAVFLAAVLVAAFIPYALAASQDAGRDAAQGGAQPAGAQSAGGADGGDAVYENSEIVYATLAATGSPEAVYVINRFDVEGAGTLVDHGDYSVVKNLTDGAEMVNEDGTVEVDVSEGVFYYQGTAAQAELPWNVALSYELDGRPVSPDDLAGASGALSIHVATTQNPAVDPAFYESFMLQVTFTLDGQTTSGIQADGATVAASGQDWTVAFTALPGRDGDFTLTAQVEDFSMAGAQIAALPYASVVEMPDTGGMTEGMDDLASAVSRLSDGVAQLSEGADSLAAGAGEIAAGAEGFRQGLGQLDAGAASLVDASGQIEGALTAVASGLAGADLGALGELEQLPAALRQLADGLDGPGGLRENVQVVETAYDQATGALDAAVAGIPAASLNDDALASLADAVKAGGTQDDAATLEQLTATYQAAQRVRMAYYGPNGTDGAAAALGAAGTLLDGLAADAASGGALAASAQALRTMADALESSLAGGALDQLPALAEGLSQLAGEYGRFHEGLAEYADGVSTLASQYGAFASGTSSLAGGAGELADGTGEMDAGMREFDASVSELPETMREQIDELTADFTFPEFDPVSFVSPENGNVTAVQFVMTTAAIEKPEAAQEEEPEASEPTLWDRLLALFS